MEEEEWFCPHCVGEKTGRDNEPPCPYCEPEDDGRAWGAEVADNE